MNKCLSGKSWLCAAIAVCILVSAAGIPLSAQDQAPAPAPAESPFLVSVAAVSTVVVPLPTASSMSIGALNSLYLTFQFLLGPGYLGTGALIGAALTESNTGNTDNFFLYNFPAGLCLQYTWLVTGSIILYLEANGGISLNWIKFYQTLPDVTTYMPYAQAYLGLGLYSKGITFSLLAGAMDIFFTNSQLLAVTTGIRMSFNP
jgi:hypothetical protein